MAQIDASQSVHFMDEQTDTDAAAYQLASIVESSGDAMVSRTLYGVITHWNSSAEKLFGYTADEVIGQSMLLLIAPDRQEEGVEIGARLRAGETVKDYETTRVRKDGSCIDVSITVFPILDAERRIIGVSAIVHDIAEQKRMIKDLATRSQELENSNKKLATRTQQLEGSVEELATRSQELEGSVEELATRTQQLENSNKKYATRTQQLERTRSRLRAIIDASQDAMLLLLPDGRPIEVNTRFTDFFEFDDTTVLAQSADQMTALLKEQFIDTPLLGRSLARNTVDQGHIFREQLVQVGPGGRNFDLYSLPVINVDQTYSGRLYVWHDATQERAIDRMKSEFVSMVSHELRTPLTSIKGYVDLLLTDDTVGDLTGLQRDFLGITHNNALRLETLINDLLDLTSMESGKLELHHSQLDINLLIGELMPSFQPFWDARRQTFTLHLPESAPIALGDANRVKQILSNLLSNAHKYTPEGGCIDITVETAEPVVRIAITDSGIGLSIGEQAQLFTRFYRAHNAITEAGGGTGLGLVICRSLVEMQGGEIQVVSEPGHGSTFRFTLPLA
ncbi:MAG TPA: PAS domain S-box protein [Ktedonobacteraceae bacterium]